MLTQQEQSRLRGLVSSADWAILQRLADLVCQRIKSNPLSRESEWELTRSTLEQEGQIQGIRKFIDEIVNQTK